MRIRGWSSSAFGDRLVALLEGEGPRSARRILILPTTSETLAALQKVARDVIVVSDHPDVRTGVHGRIVRPLDAVRAPPVDRADIVCFPDQYVSPVLSPLLGAHAGAHVSAVELVLAHATSAHIHGWWNPAMPPAYEAADVVAMIEAYFRHCESLGERWTLRHAQGPRDPRERRRRLHHRVNHMASSVLHNALSAGRADVAQQCWQRLQLMSARIPR